MTRGGARSSPGAAAFSITLPPPSPAMNRSVLALALLLPAACAPAAPVAEAPPPAAPAPAPAPPPPAAPPGTEVYLAELAVRDGALVVGTPANVTRRPGYDNQPGFTPEGDAILYTSGPADGQTDIFRYDLASGATTRVTRTPESEYSPTVLPGGGGFSAVRVEADSTQRLWAFRLDGSDPRLVLENVKPVGYHAWIGPHTLALFVLGSPPTLQLADTRTGEAEVVASGIGRSLHRIPGREAASFVHKVSPREWWISELDPETRRVTRLVRTLPGVEDYAWMPDGTLLAARGSRLYRWAPGRGPGWEVVADFGAAGIAGVTRLAVSPRGDRLALVAAER